MNETIQCVNGLCEHPEHTVNAFVWILPAIAGAYLISKALLKKCKRKK